MALLLRNRLLNSYSALVRSCGLGSGLAPSSSSSGSHAKTLAHSFSSKPLSSNETGVQESLPPASVDLKSLSSLNLSNINVQLTPVRQVWVEGMSSPDSIKLAILPLHPSVFSVFPRPDLIQENHKWQTLYKHVDYRCMKTRAELRGTNRKPWPQKGTGRARHSNRKAPQWHNGGWASGPRGPRTYFYMLPWHKRVAGLQAMLSAKLSQNDLFVVDDFAHFPEDATEAHLAELIETRGWGPSVLFVDQFDLEHQHELMDQCRLVACASAVEHVNVMAVHELNVYSLLKHETLVITARALKEIEERILYHLKRIDLSNVIFKHKPDGVYKM